MMGPCSRGWARTTDMRLQRPPFFQLNYPGRCSDGLYYTTGAGSCKGRALMFRPL